jgi:lipopolysaccharide transport system ATP-binding protein
MGTPIFGSNPRFQPQANQLKNSKSGIVRFRVDGLPIHAGKYQVSVWLGDWHCDFDTQPDAISFDFRPDHSFSNMPNPENIGHLDWSCAWTMIG